MRVHLILATVAAFPVQAQQAPGPGAQSAAVISSGPNVQVSKPFPRLYHGENLAAGDPDNAGRLLACSTVAHQDLAAQGNHCYVSFDHGKTWSTALEFEMNVDGLVSLGGLGGPAILPQALGKMAQLTTAIPSGSFSGIGGIATFAHAMNYFLLGCGTVQVCTAAMLDHAIGPNVIRELTDGLRAFLDRNADRGWTSVDDIRGLRRDRIVSHSRIRRPDDKDYHGGYEAEGYAQAAGSPR